MKTAVGARTKPARQSVWITMGRDLKRNKLLYLMVLPVIAYYLIFDYGPMYGLQIAFKDYSPGDGIWSSPWVGFNHFVEFFNSYYFWRLIRNTLLINVYELIFGFPAPIILALLFNELRRQYFKRIVQTITYLPHFISVVVVVGMLVDFLARDGLVNQLLSMLGFAAKSYLSEPEWFRFLYVSSGIWQQVGWGSIIYLAALSTIDPTLYEAARVDGAGRWKQMVHITIPGIMPTVIILLILKMGSMMSVGSEKILLMYNPLTYDTADVISTFVYRKGILEASYSYTTAVGLFNAVIAFTLLILSNSISKRVSETKLW
nr:ABC transporter permease subunit [Paenibacillus chinjuensis]